MKTIINILFLISILTGFSQNIEEKESQIFEKIVTHEFQYGGIYLGCTKSKTYFDSAELTKQSGLEIPENILEELTKSSELSKKETWSPKLIKRNHKKYSTKYIKKGKCLSGKDSERLFERTKKRQTIVLISKPIFDSEFENCIVSVKYLRYTRSANGNTYFLKKIYGKWIIVATYDLWLT